MNMSREQWEIEAETKRMSATDIKPMRPYDGTVKKIDGVDRAGFTGTPEQTNREKDMSATPTRV